MSSLIRKRLIESLYTSCSFLVAGWVQIETQDQALILLNWNPTELIKLVI